MDRRRSREDDEYSSYDMSIDKKFNSLIKFIDIKKALDGHEKKLIEIKRHFITKHVNLDSIISSSVSMTNKMNLLKLYFDLLAATDIDIYIDKYFKLYDMFECYKKMVYEVESNEGLIDKLLSIKLNDKYKKYIYEKIDIITTGKTSEEANKSRSYLNFVLDFPFGVYREVDMDIGKQLCLVENHLNNNLYGMKSCKRQILRHVMNFKMGNTTNVVALCGNAGVGKTKMVRVLADVLGVPFRLIQGGCLTNLETLMGHSYTYVGATPGMLARTIKDFGCLSGIICIDEIDKITNQSVMNALIHVLDRTQSDCFCDEFIGDIPIDLSKIMFFCTLNDVGKLGDILKNRMLLVKVDGYTVMEKVEIAKKHIIPNLIKNMTIRDKKILDIGEDLIRYIMDESDGVRELERRLGGVIDNIQYKYLTDAKRIDVNKNLTIDGFKIFLE